MKKLFTLAFLCVSLSAFSQPKYYGNFYGNITNATGAASMQTVISSTNWIGSDGKMSTFGGVMNFNQGASGAFNFGQTGFGSQDGHVTGGDFTATLNPGFIGSGKFTSTTIATGIVTNLFLIGATNAPLVAYGGDGHVGPTNSLETLTNVIVTGKAGNKVYLGGNFKGATNLLEFGSGTTMTANVTTNGVYYGNGGGLTNILSVPFSVCNSYYGYTEATGERWMPVTVQNGFATSSSASEINVRQIMPFTNTTAITAIRARLYAGSGPLGTGTNLVFRVYTNGVSCANALILTLTGSSATVINDIATGYIPWTGGTNEISISCSNNTAGATVPHNLTLRVEGY